MSLPTVINLPITELCDSRCIMCNVWNAGKTDQFTTEDINNIFSQDFFKKVKHIGISGGEPTLNENLTEICKTLLNCLSSLKSLSITSNGYNLKKQKAVLPLIFEVCKKKNVSFSLNLSIDGIGENHEKIRHIDGAFEKVAATAKFAKQLGIPIQIQCTILPINVYNIVYVREYAIENNYDVIFRIASYITRLSNKNLSKSFTLNSKERSFVADFLESTRTITATKSLGRRLFYKDLANRLKTNAPRIAPCSFQNNALFLAPDKTIRNCSRSEKELEVENINNISQSINSPKNQSILNNLISNTCKTCYHDQSGHWPLWKYLTVHNKLFYQIRYLKKLIKGGKILKNLLLPIKSKNIEVKKLKSVLITGCYGGEHVGDAAIMGGVILRVIKKYGVKNVTVTSFRPDRTKCWIQNLNINEVSINAIANNKKLIPDNYDALILGGGPIMSIPILLSNHLSLIRSFKKSSKPFLIEGVGIGPLKNMLTKYLADKILNSADLITVRTHKDHSIAQTLRSDVIKTNDPAFDYLSQLNQNSFEPHPTLASILDTEKDIWVINLRPLWQKFSNGNDNISTRIENNLIESIAQTLVNYKNNRRFIFMPMNADQFGFSDIEIAYKLEKKITSSSENVDFKVWEFEPDINNCAYLLKKASLMISMRFHGCIFSIANKVPTIGIDYSTAEKGKVFSLFEDLKIENRVLSIKNVNIKNLTKKIDSIVIN